MKPNVEHETRWRGQPDTSKRRFRLLVAISVLLHAPLTPLAGLLGLLSLLGPPPEAPPEELNSIPITLLDADELERMGGAKSTPEPAPAPPTGGESVTEEELAALFDDEPPPKPPKPRPQVTDAGAPKEPADAAAPEPKRDARPAETPAEAGGRDAGAKRVDDPMALAGAASSVADPNANVKLLLLNDRIKGTPLGARIGRIVAQLPQWRSFFGPAGLDPVNDVSRIYVAGPQFRVSAEVIAVIEHNVPQKRMREAIDSIVRREPRGQWLDTKIPAARARADRADRTFILPSPHIVVMVPPKLTDEAIEKGRSLRFPRVGGDAALVAFVATPWRALMGLNVPFTIPKSIASVMLMVTPTAEGGATIRIEATDDSPESADEHAQLLTRGINLATQRDMGPLGFLVGAQKLQLIEPVKLRANGKRIEGTARVTPRQLDRILNFAEGWLDMLDRARQPRVSPSAIPTPPGSPPPTRPTTP